MSPDINFGEDDTSPVLTRTLTLPDGTVPDLTGATVTIRYRSKDSLNEADRVTAPMAVVDDPTLAHVELHLASRITRGEYNADIHAVLQGGDTITFPNGGGYYWMSVQPAP